MVGYLEGGYGRYLLGNIFWSGCVVLVDNVDGDIFYLFVVEYGSYEKECE